MAEKQVNPTRMELTSKKKKLATAMRGHKLLKDKRDELMRQFIELVRENMALRLEVEDGLNRAAVNFAMARASMAGPLLDTALLIPGQQVGIEAGSKNVMGVLVPRFEFKTRNPSEDGIYSYGLAFTSGDLDFASKSLADILPKLLRLAEVEKSCRLMSAEIEKTRRRVNALEYMVIPETRAAIRFITMKLDESERSGQIRLMKVKDMMLRAARAEA